jgi:hypothetical protein
VDSRHDGCYSLVLVLKEHKEKRMKKETEEKIRNEKREKQKLIGTCFLRL